MYIDLLRRWHTTTNGGISSAESRSYSRTRRGFKVVTVNGPPPCAPTGVAVAQGWTPPVSQPGTPLIGQAPPGAVPAGPGGQVGTTDPNQLPNGVNPTDYENMFGDESVAVDLGAFGKSDRKGSPLAYQYSTTNKVDMAAGILALIIVAGLATWAIIRYRRRKKGKTEVKDRQSQAEQGAAGETIPAGDGQFRVRREEMQEVQQKKQPQQPENAYRGLQATQKSHPIYSRRNPRRNLRNIERDPRPGTPTPPVPPLSPARERYYNRDRSQGKRLFKQPEK